MKKQRQKINRARPDLSDKITHLLRGDTMEDTFNTMRKILEEKQLVAGSGNMKKGISSICFTETPVAQLALSLFDRENNKFKYRPVGIIVSKEIAFEHGARPAIYQSDVEYEALPESQRYRHVRFEPGNAVDFTWEREWRLPLPVFPLDPACVTLLVPHRAWADALIDEHTGQVRAAVAGAASVEEAAAAVTRYPWHIIALSDLGIDVPDFEA
jgi:hypothetical protein